MATEASGSHYHAKSPLPDTAPPSGQMSPSASSPDSIMRDNDSTVSTANPTPAHLYSPHLSEEGNMDQVGTPFASNRAGCPLVTLQPKPRNDNTQTPAAQLNSAENAASRTPPRAPGRPSSIAGRGPHLRSHDTQHPRRANENLQPTASRRLVDNANDDGFTLVNYSKSKSKNGQVEQADMQVSGLLLSRVGPKADLEKQPIPFGTLLQALISIDPNVMIFPYNCAVDNIHKATSLLKHSQDYKSLMDITLVNWGSPSEAKGKLAFSFYIGSTIIGEDLHAVKQSKLFQQFLTQSKLQVTPHYLHQTESKPVAFFSGKSPTHTWRQELRERFQEYLNTHLKDPNVILDIFGDDKQVPSIIPFYLKVGKIRTKNTSATAIMLYVGKAHQTDAITLLTKAPFKDIKIVLIGNRRRDQAVYEKQISIHKWLCQKSTAVKLRYTTDTFRSAIRTKIKSNETVQKAVIDVAEASSTRSEGTLYIQCLTKHKELVKEFSENFIAAFNTQNPDECEAEVVQPQNSRTTNPSVSPNQTINTWSRWQEDMEEDISLNTINSKSSIRKVPGTIEACHSLSYASIVAGHHQSNISSPTTSRTGTHSIRVTELELENERLRSRLQEFASSQQSLSTSSKSSSKSKREIELELEVNEVKSLLAQQMEKFDGLEQKFDMLLRQLQPSTNIQQPQTNPAPPRKRKSDKHLFKNSGGRRIHNSDAGTITPASEPPDPESIAANGNNTSVHMDTDDKTIEGGIADNDLSEQMIQNWEDSNSTDSIMSASPVANGKKND